MEEGAIDILLELLQSQHHKGLSVQQVWSDEDSLSAQAAAAAFLQEDETPALQQQTAERWFSILLKKETMISSQEAHALKTLRQRWQSDQDRHALCKQSLNRNLFLRLLAFISDLLDYKDSIDAQQRMEFLLPTASALFASPLYFPQQPQDGSSLNSFVAPNGLTVLQTLAAQFERSPRLEGVCTAHTLTPLLKRLFAIDDDSFNSKEFKEFRREFNRAANEKFIQPTCTSHDKSKHHKQAAQGKKKQQQKVNEKKKKSKSRG